MEISELMAGGERELFDAIRDFKILQLKIVKQSDGGGVIKITAFIDEQKMAIVEKILNNTRR